MPTKSYIDTYNSKVQWMKAGGDGDCRLNPMEFVYYVIDSQRPVMDRHHFVTELGLGDRFLIEQFKEFGKAAPFDPQNPNLAQAKQQKLMPDTMARIMTAISGKDFSFWQQPHYTLEDAKEINLNLKADLSRISGDAILTNRSEDMAHRRPYSSRDHKAQGLPYRSSREFILRGGRNNAPPVR